MKSKDAEKSTNNQTILWFVFLVIISLFLGSLPALSFGQGFDLPTAVTDSAPTFGAPAPLAIAPTEPAASPTGFLPTSVPAEPKTASVADQSPTLPVTPTSLKTAPTTSQPELLRSVATEDHPFYNYFNASNDPKSPVQGKPYAVEQLLNGVRDPSARRQLLGSYWELAGILAEWNMRFDSERRVSVWYNEANNARNVQRAEGFTGAFYLAQQQRKATEIAFAKKQYQLVEQLRALRGITLTAKDYPIPSDYPIAKNYVTYADKIARSERARYTGRMISLQAELVDARKNSQQAANGYFVKMTQNPQGSPQDHVLALNQRTDAFVDLVASVVDYNKMIAEYTSETIGANVSNTQLLGALLELPKAGTASPTGPPTQLATPPQRTFTQLDDPLPPPPMTLAPGESAYSRPLDEPVTTGLLSNPFSEVKSQPVHPTRPLVAENAQPLPEVEPMEPAPNPIQSASFVEETE